MAMYQDEEFMEVVARLKERMTEQIDKLMEDLKAAAKKAGYQVGTIEDVTDDEFKWTFIIHVTEVPAEEVGKWHTTDLGVDFTIVESLVHDGTDDGINFCLAFQGDGGVTYRQVCPYTFTPQCWVSVNDNDAIEERFNIVVENSQEAMAVAIGDMEATEVQDEKRGVYGDTP